MGQAVSACRRFSFRFIKLRLNLVFFIAISIVLCYPTNGTKIISFWELYFHRFAVNFGNVCLDRSTETEGLFAQKLSAPFGLCRKALFI